MQSRTVCGLVHSPIQTALFPVFMMAICMLSCITSSIQDGLKNFANKQLNWTSAYQRLHMTLPAHGIADTCPDKYTTLLDAKHFSIQQGSLC